MLLTALSFLVVAQSSSEVPEGLMNNPVLFGFLLDSVQAAQNTDTVNELPITKCDDRYTVWHLTTLGRKVQVLENLLDCANEKLTIEKVNNRP